MGARMMSWLWQPGRLWALFSQVRLASRLLREPRVPLWTKAVPLLAVLYVASPLDLVPDFFPLFGQIDDVSLFLIVLAVFPRLCPAAPVEFHRAAIAEGRRYVRMTPTDGFIDAEWRRDPESATEDSRRR